MEEQFVPYELALKLKELGFEAQYLGWYYDSSSIVKEPLNDSLIQYSSIYHNGMIIAPLWQQCWDWFREKHDLHSSIIFRKDENMNFDFYKYHLQNSFHGNFKTYQEARRACLEKLIEIVQSNKS